MTDQITTDYVYRAAESILMRGVQPSIEDVAKELHCDPYEIREDYDAWWVQLSNRLKTPEAIGEIPLTEMPAFIGHAFQRIWHQAVLEAHSQISEERHIHDADLFESNKAAEEQLHKLRQSLRMVEERYRVESARLDDANTQIRALEAEIQVLKANLAGETSTRKNEEKMRSNLEQELAHLRKSYDESRRTFDKRIKDEQRHVVEAVAKAEADVRYYRSALEKVRDDAGKKESVLARSIHDLQGEVAKKDVKLETQRTQIRSLEEELKSLKTDSGGRNRDLSKLNGQLLAETNKTKRLSDKIEEQEVALRQLQQKLGISGQDASRREAQLRKQLKEREDELIRAVAKVTALEKRNISQDEEIRRLHSKL